MIAINKKLIKLVGITGGISGLIAGIVKLTPPKEWDIEEKRINFTPNAKKLPASNFKHDWDAQVKKSLPWLLIKCKDRCGWHGNASEVNWKWDSNKVVDFEFKEAEYAPIFLFDYPSNTEPSDYKELDFSKLKQLKKSGGYGKFAIILFDQENLNKTGVFKGYRGSNSQNHWQSLKDKTIDENCEAKLKIEALINNVYQVSDACVIFPLFEGFDPFNVDKSSEKVFKNNNNENDFLVTTIDNFYKQPSPEINEKNYKCRITGTDFSEDCKISHVSLTKTNEIEIEKIKKENRGVTKESLKKEKHLKIHLSEYFLKHFEFKDDQNYSIDIISSDEKLKDRRYAKAIPIFKYENSKIISKNNKN